MMSHIPLGVQEPVEVWGIDFDVVAKKKDVDLLREAVLEILAALGRDQHITRHFGPACDKLLEEREEAKP